MPQAQAKFTGYGIVYPDGVTGIKVVRTFTEGAHRSYNSDGSVRWSTPPPVIHELYGGGFCYQDGNPVTNREHLESITDVNMREDALKWFDGTREISEEATKDVPPLDLEHQRKPEPAFIVSSDMPVGDPVPEIPQPKDEVKDTGQDLNSMIDTLVKTVNTLADRIATLETAKPVPKRRGTIDPEVKMKRREQMRKYWAERRAREQGTPETGEKV